MNDLTIITAEMTEIQSEMGNRDSDYWKSPAKQARFLELVEAKHGAVSPVDFADPATLLPIASEKDYVQEHGTTAGYTEYLKTNRAVADVVLAMDESDAWDIAASFEDLPDEVAIAALKELNRSVPPAGWASDAAMASFKKRPEGPALMQIWGHEAPKRHATVCARLWRAIDDMSEAGMETFLAWLSGLSAGQLVALYRKLAA